MGLGIRQDETRPESSRRRSNNYDSLGFGTGFRSVSVAKFYHSFIFSHTSGKVTGAFGFLLADTEFESL